MTRFGFIFTTADRPFRRGARTFPSGESTFRSAEYKTNKVYR